MSSKSRVTLAVTGKRHFAAEADQIELDYMSEADKWLASIVRKKPSTFGANGLFYPLGAGIIEATSGETITTHQLAVDVFKGLTDSIVLAVTENADYCECQYGLKLLLSENLLGKSGFSLLINAIGNRLLDLFKSPMLEFAKIKKGGRVDDYIEHFIHPTSLVMHYNESLTELPGSKASDFSVGIMSCGGINFARTVGRSFLTAVENTDLTTLFDPKCELLYSPRTDIESLEVLMKQGIDFKGKYSFVYDAASDILDVVDRGLNPY